MLAGVTLTEPDRGSAAVLTLGVMVTEVALVVDQVSATGWPDATWVAAAVIFAVGAAGGGGSFWEPALPHAVSTTDSNAITSTLRILRDGRFLDMS